MVFVAISLIRSLKMRGLSGGTVSVGWLWGRCSFRKALRESMCRLDVVWIAPGGLWNVALGSRHCVLQTDGGYWYSTGFG